MGGDDIVIIKAVALGPLVCASAHYRPGLR